MTSALAVKEYFKNAEPLYQDLHATFGQKVRESRPELDSDATQGIVEFSWGTAAIHLLDPPTALISAAKAGHVEVVGALLEAKANVNQSDPSGWTALIEAAKAGHVEVVTGLLEAKANVDQLAHSGWTALLMAAQEGRVEVVGTLLEAKANVNHSKDGGLTALLAADPWHREVVRTLLEAKANVYQSDNLGRTGLNRDEMFLLQQQD